MKVQQGTMLLAWLKTLASLPLPESVIADLYLRFQEHQRCIGSREVCTFLDAYKVDPHAAVANYIVNECDIQEMI